MLSAVPDATQKRASVVRPLETPLLFMTLPRMEIGLLTSIVPDSARLRAIRLGGDAGIGVGVKVGVGVLVGTGVGVCVGVGVGVLAILST